MNADVTAIDEAASRAAAGASAPTAQLGIVAPKLGEVEGAINVTGLRDLSGRRWVRLVWGSAGNLTVIDLPAFEPVDGPNAGRNMALGVGRAITEAATGIVMPS